MDDQTAHRGLREGGGEARAQSRTKGNDHRGPQSLDDSSRRARSISRSETIGEVRDRRETRLDATMFLLEGDDDRQIRASLAHRSGDLRGEPARDLTAIGFDPYRATCARRRPKKTPARIGARAFSTKPIPDISRQTRKATPFICPIVKHGTASDAVAHTSYSGPTVQRACPAPPRTPYS